MVLFGLSGWAAYQAFLKFAWYLPMAERFKGIKNKNEVLEKYYELPKESKLAVIVEILGVAPIDDDDAMRLLSVHSDENGVPYIKESIGNLKPDEIFEMISETLLCCGECNQQLFF